MLRERRVAPSILSADFARLGAQVDEVSAAGARVIHVDVMDGHFVPPITFGALIVDALAEQVHDAGGVLDVHLMIERPERYVSEIAKAGADSITIHVEATPHVHYTLERDPRGRVHGRRRDQCPATPARRSRRGRGRAARPGAVHERQPRLGRAGVHSRVARQALAHARRAPDHVALEVDGGVHEGTAGSCVQAGANLLVTGSAVFGTADPAGAYAAMVAAAAGRLRPSSPTREQSATRDAASG